MDIQDENVKLTAIRFLIENFVYMADESNINRAIAIDKIQTFYMIFSEHVKLQADKHKLEKNYLKYLKDQKTEFITETEINNIDSNFSTKEAEKIFTAIFNNESYNHSFPEDRLLAFQLADGLLDAPIIKEYAFLELLYLKKNNIDWLNINTKRIQKKISDSINSEDSEKRVKFIKSIVSDYSDSELKRIYTELSSIDGILNYFNYQKVNDFPIINGWLYDIWVKKIIDHLKIIITIIFDFKQKSEKYSKLDTYFSGLLSRSQSKGIKVNHIITCHTDLNIKKKISLINNDVENLIFRLFSDIDLDAFAICECRGCKNGIKIRGKKKKKLFVKYPKKDRKFCSNKCAAYEGTYRSRGL